MKRFIANKESSNSKIIKSTIAAIIPILFWVGIWWLASILLKKEVVLPPPNIVFCRLLENVTKHEFWLITLFSLFRIATGYIIAIIFGFFISSISFFVRPVRRLFEPFISVLRAVPVASYIILLYIMLSTGLIPVVTAFLIVLPIVWENIITGLENTDINLLEVCKIYNINGVRRFRYLYFPSLKPYINATILSSMGMAWKAGIAAEVLTTPKLSIGKELNNAKVYLDSPDLFAWTIVVIALSLLIEFIIKRRLNKNDYSK